MHIPTEYDYRYSSTEFREKILNAFTKNLKKRLSVFYKEEITLEKYTTTKTDKKNKVSKMPSDVSEVLRPILDSFTTMTSKIGVDDFTLIKTLGRGTFGKVMLVQKKDN